MKVMRILGLDLSFTCTGWSVLDGKSVIASGTIKTKGKDLILERMSTIACALECVVSDYRVERVAIEDTFVNHRNINTSIKLATLQGCVIGLLLNVVNAECITKYPVKFIKQTVAGHGSATKEQVLEMVKLQTDYKGDQLDISDSIAVALTLQRELNNEK